MAHFILNSLSDTERFGQCMAAGIQQHPAVHILLLHGSLGSGKTTLVRSLVEALPNGNLAEVASPSFTLCHRYPTTPPVAHHDLYRVAHSLPEELFDDLENRSLVSIVEWAEYLLGEYRPQQFLEIILQPQGTQRLCTLHAHGKAAQAFIEWLQDQCIKAKIQLAASREKRAKMTLASKERIEA
jgi:tRNA threonylcarbamoyladenosine biosynthesis protein TsaE